jgi:predicted HTH transcriptional regulator
MTLSELKSLVKKGEHQFLEFKKKADHPEKIVREMVAFANSGGGQVLIGVEDNGNIAGLRFPEGESYAMEAALASYVKPILPYSVELVKVENGKSVLVYTIEDGKEKPYFWLSDKEKQSFRVYVRFRDQSLQASKEMYQILLNAGKLSPATSLAFNAREKRLFRFLDEQGFITLDQFARLARVPKWIASKIVVQWVVQGILKIEPGASVDLYSLSSAYRSVF